MRVIICGAGQVGCSIAERLVAEQHDVTMIDIQPKLIETIRNTVEVRAIVGHGAHPEVLAAAGAEEADMIIAVTLKDEVNMIACQVAHSLFNVPTKIARIRAHAYLAAEYQSLFSWDHLPIDVVISPELETGQMLLRRISLQGAIDVLYFIDELVVALAIECTDDCPILNTSLRQLTDLFPDLETTVVAVAREGGIFAANGDTVLLAGDIAYVITTKEQLRRTLGLFGHKEQDAKRIVIAGGGNIGFYVASMLEQKQAKTRIKIIESSHQRALQISDDFRRTAVLEGSALDVKILKEAEIDKADLFIALTNQDQVNVLSAIISKRLGCKSNMVLVNDNVYQDFGRDVGIDAYFNPRSLTISKILQTMRRGRIRAVYSVANGQAEIIEGEAMVSSPLIGKAIADLELPKGVRIGAIYRKDSLIRPKGNTIIRAGDRVVLFALAENVKDVEYLFRVTLEYF